MSDKLKALRAKAPAMKESVSPKPSYGILAWAAYFLLGYFNGPRQHSLWLICCLVSLGACIGWFIVSSTHERSETVVRRVVGYFAFGFGSMLAPSAAYVVFLGAADKHSLILSMIGFVAFLTTAVGLIAGAFYLVFKRRKAVA